MKKMIFSAAFCLTTCLAASAQVKSVTVTETNSTPNTVLAAPVQVKKKKRTALSQQRTLERKTERAKAKKVQAAKADPAKGKRIKAAPAN